METTEIEFLRPRFVGERFKGHAIPLEILSDISVLEAMVIETAKWLYLSDHPERQRTPRGFSDSISIKMTEIGEGSAKPVFVLTLIASLLLFPTEQQLYLEKARDHIIEAVDAAETNGPVLEHLPDTLLGYFDRMGRSLREDECMEFRPEKPDRPARLTKATRRTLLLASARTLEYSEETKIRGFVPEVDQQRKTFSLVLRDGKRIPAPLQPQHYDTVMKAMNEYMNGTRIVLDGIGRKNRQEALQAIESAEHISILDPLDIAARLEEFEELFDGWLDGKGRGFDAVQLKTMANLFDAYYGAELPLPHMFPTPEGHVQAEWSTEAWDVSLEINPVTLSAEYQALSIHDGSATDRSFQLSSPDAWNELNAQLKTLFLEMA